MEIGIVAVLAGAVIAAVVAAIVFAIVQIVRSPELNQSERVVWVLAVVLVPLAAALVWFVGGPHPFGLRISRDIR